MNLKSLHRGIRLTLVACVAAIAVLLSGCSAIDALAKEITPHPTETEATTPNEATPQFDITKPLNPPTDEWVNWREDRDEAYAEEVSGYLAELSNIIGVEGFESPNDTYMEQGYGGVAPFGRYCIAALYFDTSSDKISLDILSRINYDVSLVTEPTSDMESLRDFADFYRTWCDEGGEWPGSPPGTQTDISVDDDTSVSA